MAGKPTLKVVSLEKSCTKCKKTKAYTDFYKSKGTLTSQCKQCTDIRLKAYHKKNPSVRSKFKTTDYNRDANYKKAYGISLAHAKEMLEIQNGLCANPTCGKELAIGRKDNKKDVAFIDHSHATGKVRGILCIGCNTCLGHLEKENRVAGLKEYMRRNGQELFN